jgi:hypothetical protein
MTIQAVITASQASIKSAVSKIQDAPPYASAARINVPTSLAYADNITMTTEAGLDITYFDLHIDIIIPVGTLESSMVWLSDIPQAVGGVFRGASKAGTSATVMGTAAAWAGDITANFVRQAVGGVDCVGYAIVVQQVKLIGE